MRYYITICISLLVFVILYAKQLFAEESTFPVSYYYHSYDLKAEGLIKSLSIDKFGFIWIASDKGGTRYDGRQEERFKNELVSHYAKGFIHRKNGEFLMVNDSGVIKIDSYIDTAVFTPYINRKLNYPKTIYEDLGGKLFIGERNDIISIHKGKITTYPLPHKNEKSSVWRSFMFDEDQHSNLWVASRSGRFYKYIRDADAFKEVKLSQTVGLINSILCVNENTIYFGTDRGLFKLKTNRNQEVLSIKKIPFDFTDISVIKQKGNTLLVGTWSNGLYQLLIDSKDIMVNKIDVLTHQDINDIFVTEEGMWIAGNEDIGFLEEVPFNSFFIENRKNAIPTIKNTPNNNLLISNGSQVF